MHNSFSNDPAKKSSQTLDTQDLTLTFSSYPVRSEAKGVPHLLVAPKPKPEGDLPEEREVEGEDVEDNDCGYYADGAYTAAPMSGVPTSASDTVAPDAQDVYYDSLSTRFNLLRATLKCTPPLSAIEVLDELHAISLPSDSRKAKQHWRDLLQTTEPHPVQLACMDSESALEVVKLLKGMMTQTVKSKDDDRIRRFGAWSWSVLGRCPDRTELGSEEIAELRALGKSAVGLSVRNRNKPRRSRDSGQPDHPESEAAEGRSGEVEEDNEAESALEKAKRRLQGALQDSEAVPKGHAEVTDDEEAEEGEVETEDADRQVNKEIRIILDMIITIVGEVYGQRDLLESRDIWTEDGEV